MALVVGKRSTKTRERRRGPGKGGEDQGKEGGPGKREIPPLRRGNRQEDLSGVCLRVLRGVGEIQIDI